MGLFKSKDERRIESEMKVRQGIRSIERLIREQDKFAEGFIKNAQHARKIGDNNQYLVTRSSLKKIAAFKRSLERQLLMVKNAMLFQQQAQATQQFAEAMKEMSRQISTIFEGLDLTKTQVDWEKAVAKSEDMDRKMGDFLDNMEGNAVSSVSPDTISDEEIDRMINADVLAAEKRELGKLDELESEIAKELGAKQKD